MQLTLFISNLFFLLINAKDMEVKLESGLSINPSSRFFGGFCCGSIRTKCVSACGGNDCSLKCTGYCGIFNTKCQYQCSSVTNACTAATTAEPTTAEATTGEATTGEATTGDATTG